MYLRRCPKTRWQQCNTSSTRALREAGSRAHLQGCQGEGQEAGQTQPEACRSHAAADPMFGWRVQRGPTPLLSGSHEMGRRPACISLCTWISHCWSSRESPRLPPSAAQSWLSRPGGAPEGRRRLGLGVGVPPVACQGCRVLCRAVGKRAEGLSKSLCFRPP